MRPIIARSLFLRNAVPDGAGQAEVCGIFPARAAKSLLNPADKDGMMFSNDRGADETALREPTGRERSGSDSAEPGRQVGRFGGAGENISGTVRGGPRGRYLLTGYSTQRAFRRLCVEAIVGRERFLYRFFVAPHKINVWRKHYEI